MTKRLLEINDTLLEISNIINKKDDTIDNIMQNFQKEKIEFIFPNAAPLGGKVAYPDKIDTTSYPSIDNIVANYDFR